MQRPGGLVHARQADLRLRFLAHASVSGCRWAQQTSFFTSTTSHRWARSVPHALRKRERQKNKRW
jgi:hypothetical protein